MNTSRNAVQVGTPTPGAGWLTTKQVAERVGVTNSVVKTWAHKGKLAALKASKSQRARLMFDPQQVAAFASSYVNRLHGVNGHWRATMEALPTMAIARELGVTQSAVGRMIRLGALMGERSGPRHWRVTRQALDAYLASHPKRRRATKTAAMRARSARPEPSAPQGALGRIEALLQQVLDGVAVVEAQNKSLMAVLR